MKKYLKFLPFALLLVANLGHASALVERAVLNNLLSVSMPQAFEVMEPELQKIKYPNKASAEIYTDSTSKVNVAFETMAIQTKEEDADILLERLKAQMQQQLAAYKPNSEWATVNGRRVVRINFISQAVDTRIHNIMQFMVVNNKLVIASFNVTIDLEKQWLDTGKAILQSMKAK